MSNATIQDLLSKQELNFPCPGEHVLPCQRKAQGRPKAADAEARLQELIVIAAQLFMEKGYNKVSLEMIAKQARVAVRTIYVKFGGKAGLFSAVIAAGRTHFFADMDDLDTTTRPLRDVLADFGLHFLDLVTSPVAVALHRIVIAESQSTPELARAYYDVGPRQTREQIARLLSRPDIRAQLRDDVPVEMLAVQFLNCLMGDHMGRLLFQPDSAPAPEVMQRQLNIGLDMFLGGALRRPAPASA
ncbi:efflux system transcriptional repressor NalC [Pseudoduganella ginsengisoli]|uniref:TetR family transcriptional regulator n=1 Tax=Pseudoduganella ginsengisoli TaxID=1462440 RepID=A0A6L6PTL3_9BURK|nr:TetR/AcrR family transcriptional regulator [Pseudoduganella ginsengisoli]MTW00619.1 TetR family transcriptional regulator [Pseudoduganella ginsengisoli]